MRRLGADDSASAGCHEHDHLPRRPALRFKRAMDVCCAAAGLVLLSPVLVAVGLAVVLDSGWPPLFTQVRVGQAGRRFRLHKFRTMVVGAESMGAGLFVAPGDSRFTRIGRFLRRTSLDELPQLVNVLLGHESLVGPRPMLPYTADRLTPEQERRHRVPPGITGWAQVNGRNMIPWSRRIELDNWYIDNWSLRLDLLILVRTVGYVLSGSDIPDHQLPSESDDLGPPK